MIRCTECGKPVLEDLKYAQWLTLFNFIQFLFFEKYIEQETRDEMLNCLLSFKAFACEDQRWEEGKNG